MSLQVKTDNQNDWSVTIQIEYTGLRQDYYFKLKLICKFFYRKGPALIYMFLYAVLLSASNELAEYETAIGHIFEALHTYEEAVWVAEESGQINELAHLLCSCSKLSLKLKNYEATIGYADRCVGVDRSCTTVCTSK